MNAVEPEGGLVNLKLKTSSVTVRVKVCADDRSKVTTLLAEVTTPTLSWYVLNLVDPSKSISALGTNVPSPTLVGVIETPLPTFIKSVSKSLSKRNSIASARSSEYRNSLNGLPVPHNSNSGLFSTTCSIKSIDKFCGVNDKSNVVKDEYVVQTMRYLELLKELKKSGNKKQKVI